MKPFAAWVVIDTKGYYSPMFHLKMREAKDCRERYAHLRESDFKVVKVRVSKWRTLP